MKKILEVAMLFLTMLIITACNHTSFNEPKEITQEELKDFFAKHRVGKNSNYAIIKNGEDYLTTIHGYMDNYQVCAEVIKPYNENPKLSRVPGTYDCVKLN